MPHVMPYPPQFPQTVPEIFGFGTHHACVRHSILSIASAVADHRLSRSMNRFKIHYITALQQIQMAIQEMRIDEGLLIAVFLIAWIDSIQSKFTTARKHLEGLRLILKQMESTYHSPTNLLDPTMMPPLVMQIWRIAIKLDWNAAMFTVNAPIFPTVPAAEDLHGQWIVRAAASGDAAEWALTAFGIDNLIHKACHFAASVRALRQEKHNQDIEKKVASIVELLNNEVQAWRNRPIIQMADNLEQIPYDSSTCPEDSASTEIFLHYPLLRIRNPLYVNLLNQWRALSIYISFILDPTIGHGSYPLRFGYAVDICRTLAALGPDRGQHVSSKIWVMIYTAATFGGLGPARQEAMWLKAKAEEFATYIPVTKIAVDRYMRLCETGNNIWEELGKVAQRVDIM
jgi:Fungal specific transcription factor domain